MHSSDILKSLESIERAIWATQQKPEMKSVLPSLRPLAGDVASAATVLLSGLIGSPTTGDTITTTPGELVIIGASWSVTGVPIYQHTLVIRLSFNGSDWYTVRSDTLSGSSSYVLEFHAGAMVQAVVESTGTEGAGIGFDMRVEGWHGRS